VAIPRDQERWSPLSREEAVRACAFKQIAVVYRVQGMPAADWLTPDNRFYRADQPYLYDELRYYAYAEPRLGKLKGLRIDRPLGEAEVLQAWDDVGEALNLGSPVPGANKPKPKLPIEFQLTDAQGLPMAGVAYEVILPDGKAVSGISDSAGLIAFPDNIHPGEAKLKLIPENAQTPADASRGSGSPALAASALAALPDVVKIIPDSPPGTLFPISYRLITPEGKPIPPTHYQLTLPNGEVKTGESDQDGYVRYPDNPHPGKATLVLIDRGNFPIEILLTDHDETPLANKPYRLRMPDGSMREGISDSEGYIRHPDNDHEGDAHLVLPDYA
jgi:hypothetical protein